MRNNNTKVAGWVGRAVGGVMEQQRSAHDKTDCNTKATECNTGLLRNSQT